MSFIEDVREAVSAIPPGHVMSYGDIGRRIGVGPRLVGRAMSLMDGVPWWRVAYAGGTPAKCHDGQALTLLLEEGTPLIGGRVDMNRARMSRPEKLTEAHP